DLQQRLHLAYLFISHDLAVVRHVADRVAVMNLGCIVENADAQELFAAPRHPYSRALLSAIPVPQPRARRSRIILPGDMPHARRAPPASSSRPTSRAPPTPPPPAPSIPAVPMRSRIAPSSRPRSRLTRTATRPPAIASPNCRRRASRSPRIADFRPRSIE